MKSYGRLWDYDLTSRTLTKKYISNEVINKYLGDRGLSTYLMSTYSFVGADTLFAKNIMIFMSGSLIETQASGPGKYLAITKSPVIEGDCWRAT